ncbi:hemicentin-2-like [Tropilaelaps mercedesae]|uniref:Hemicentin-2-like n=1 Tax=Tropilaelaps mercedesae TaxID=418985 RepID=A0A1V9XSY8_9ACAR|nr:hemicentin-2-like [Tropilaelaps mercedesae]
MTPRARYHLFLVSLLFSTTSAGEAPQISPIKVPENLEEGQRLFIVCGVLKGSPPISFAWFKDNTPLISSLDLIIMQTNSYQEQLNIERLTADHIGNYSCSAKNSHGFDKITVPVLLKFAPRWIVNILPSNETSQVEAVSGGSVTIDCRAVGHPTPSVTVTKGG